MSSGENLEKINHSYLLLLTNMCHLFGKSSDISTSNPYKKPEVLSASAQKSLSPHITTILGDLFFELKLIDFIFQSNFRFTTKLIKKYRGVPYSSCPCTCTASPRSVPHQTSPFVTSDEPTLTHPITPNPWLTLGLTLGVEHSTGSDKCVVTGIQYYCIRKCSFQCPKNPLCSTYLSFLHPQPLQPFIFLLPPQFFLFQNVTQL